MYIRLIIISVKRNYSNLLEVTCLKKYKNKFLDKIGYKDSTTKNLFYGSLQDDKRNNRWEKQRKKWGGYDERVGWSLNSYMTEQIYTWLKIYLLKADGFVDLTFHKFDVDGKELTEKEAILSILEDLEYWLLNSEKWDEAILKECTVRSERAYRLLGIILPSLWW